MREDKRLEMAYQFFDKTIGKIKPSEQPNKGGHFEWHNETDKTSVFWVNPYTNKAYLFFNYIDSTRKIFGLNDGELYGLAFKWVINNMPTEITFEGYL